MQRLELGDLFHPGFEARGALAASPLARIDALAGEIARVAPAARAGADEIRALVCEARRGPNLDEIQEAIERVCGDDLSGICVARIADAVARLMRGR